MIQEVTPRRIWYLIPLLILLAGGVAGGLMLADGIAGLRAPLIRMVAPSTEEIRFPEAGSWTVFHEYRGTVDGVSFDTAAMEPRFQLIVTSRSGDQVTTSLAKGGLTYDLPHAEGYSVGSFRLQEPGTYTVEAGDSMQSSHFILAFGHEKGGAVGRLVGGIALISGTLFLAVITFGLILLFRVRSKRRIERESYVAGLPPPPGAAPPTP